MKYIILHDSTYHADFDNFEEADNYYRELVDEDGDYFDLTLCRVVDSHEATPIGKEINNLSDIAYSPYFNRGRY